MTGNAGVRLGWPALVAAALLLIAIGALGSFLAIRASVGPFGANRLNTDGAPLDNQPRSPAERRENTSGSTPGAPMPEIVIRLSEEAIERAGIVVAAAQSGAVSGELRLPAVVEPNGYAQVTVTPVVTGRITRVLVESGAQVRQGQLLASIFSPELADAQTRYISARAELDAHERELARTEKLVQIGAASRQELERIHAEHTAKLTSVESAGSRLELLGLSRDTIDGLGVGKPLDATTDVVAPIAGVVTERFANVGLNVDPAARLFTVVDLSTVWIIASLYEQDFARVHVGDRASVVTAAYADAQLRGRVSYIDPQLNRESRTAKVRVEVQNARQELRLGMLAEARIEGRSSTATLVPRSAVQQVGDRSVVYVTHGAPAQFAEREVRLGQPSGQLVQVLSGVAPGDMVVVEGSFFLRAERERLGARASAP